MNSVNSLYHEDYTEPQIKTFIKYYTVPYCMTEYQITCVTQNSLGNITQVGIGGKTHQISTVVNWIQNKTHSFHTYKNGYKARVYAKQSNLGNWFLTTSPDSALENNLDFLSSC